MAVVVGNVVYGLSAGSVQVCADVQRNLGCVEIMVSDETVRVAQVVGSLLVELSLEANSTVATGVVDTATIGARSELQFEQERGELLVALLYSDGAYSSVNTSEVSLQPSSNLTVYYVQDGRIVARGSGEALATFTWRPLNGSCGLIVHQTVPVVASLPLPVALRTSLLPPPHNHSITTPGSAAALVGIPTQLVLQVELEYPDGRRLSITSDSRVMYSTSANLINVDDNSGIITATSQVPGSVQLTASFTSSEVTLEALVMIDVIQPVELLLEAFPYPPYPGSENSPTTTLSPIENTGAYQRVSLRVTLSLSDGSRRDVTLHASTRLAALALSGAPGPLLSTDGILAVSGDGLTNISATFGPVAVSVLLLSGNPIQVTDFSINPLPSNTLRGVPGTIATQLSVDLTFSDGTQFLNFPIDPAFTSFPISGLVSFSSPSASPAFNVSQEGALQPLSNTISPVTVQATAGIRRLSRTTDFVVNLDAAVGDVDMGSVSGVPIPLTQPSSELAIPVRVNTGGSNLGSIDIVAMYDSSVLSPISVDLGPDWNGINGSRLNDPPGEIQFGGSISVDGIAGLSLHLFTLRLRVVSASSTGRSFLNGTVLTFAERNIDGTTIGPLTPRPIVAGDLVFQTGVNVGKRSTSSHPNHDPTPVRKSRERRAVGECPSPPCSCSGECPGDTDGNCIFDIRDVTFTLIYITESLLGFNRPLGQEIQNRITAAQLGQLDATQDGIVNTNDAYFLLRAVFRLVYFLQSIQITPIQDTASACLVTIEVQLQSANNGSVGQVDVLTDVALTDSSRQTQFESSIINGRLLSSKGPQLHGGFILAERMSEDVFIVKLAPDFVSDDIGVSVFLISFDALNSTSTSRVAQFLGPPPPTYPAALDVSLSVRGELIQLAALSGYSPLLTFSNTLPSSLCSDDPLLSAELNVTFTSPFQALVEWNLDNLRLGLDFTSVLRLHLTGCSVDQNGNTRLDVCTHPAEQIPVQNNTMHTLEVRPFMDYFLQVVGPTTNTTEVAARSPESSPEGLATPTYTYFEGAAHFMWGLPSSPNGIITHYTLYVNGKVVFNGTSLSHLYDEEFDQQANYSLEAYNSAGSVRSDLGVLIPPSPITATLSPRLSVAITDLIIISAVLTVCVLIVLLSAMGYGMIRVRQAAKEKPPSFLSLNFSTENDGVEEKPLTDDSVCVLLPLGEQKGKWFAEKFVKEDQRAFWYRDERQIELLPPPDYESSSSDSSDGEELGYTDEQWELGGVAGDTYDDKDIYDLWDESPPEGKSRKHSTTKRSHGRKTSKDSSHRHSSVLRRLSFMRQPSEQDELHLLEEAELGELDEDTGQFRQERRRKTSVAEMKKKRLSSSEGGAGPRWSVSPLHEVEEETNVDEHLVQLPQPSTETAEEVAGRLRSKLKSGEFQNEYKDLLTVKASSAPVQSARSCNTQKNRYRNVLAADHTRVKLKDANPVVDGSEYINANYIDGHGRAKAYIATQGPLPNTIEDFWKMVWQEGSESIVMATGVTENQRKKSEKYWPDKGHSRKYGPVVIKCVEQIKHEGFTESKLMVTCDSHLRRVTHYHYTSWPDFGTPPAESFLEMTKAVASKDTPVVVHCSAGLGRTGIFITVHTALECFKDKRMVDVKEITSKIRRQREGMIQSQDQYKFCLEAVAAALAPEEVQADSEPLPPPPPPPAMFGETGQVTTSPVSTFSADISSSHGTERCNDDITGDVSPPGASTPPPAARASPPPPSSSPPPPISEPQTPFKVPLPSPSPPSTPVPDIMFTGPTPRASREETDRELIQRKLDSMANERRNEDQEASKNEESPVAKEQPRQETEKPIRDSVASITQRTPTVKPEQTKKILEDKYRKEERGQASREDERREKKEVDKVAVKRSTQSKETKDKDVKIKGATKPPPAKKVEKDRYQLPKKEGKDQLPKEDQHGDKGAPKKDRPGESEAKLEKTEKEEVEEEDMGFSIGDEPLDFKPPPKKPLKDQKQPRPAGQPSWKQPPKKASPFTPPKATPSPPTKTTSPAQEKTRHPPTPKLSHRPEVVKSELEVYTKAVGKIAIPSIFGGSSQSPSPSPQASPNPSPRRFGHTAADTTNNEDEPQAKKLPAFGQRVLPQGIQPASETDVVKRPDWSKKPASSSTPTPYKLPTLPQRTVWSSAASSSASSPKPTYKLPTPAQKQTAKPALAETESRPEISRHTSAESSSSSPHPGAGSSSPAMGGNVARLMMRFQGGQ